MLAVRFHQIVDSPCLVCPSSAVIDTCRLCGVVLCLRDTRKEFTSAPFGGPFTITYELFFFVVEKVICPVMRQDHDFFHGVHRLAVQRVAPVSNGQYVGSRRVPPLRTTPG